MQGPMNIADGIELSGLNSIFFLRDSCSNVALHNHNFSLIDKCGVFSYKIFMHTLQLLRLEVCIEGLIAV